MRFSGLIAALLAPLALLLLVPNPAAAQRTKVPAQGMLYIRLYGSVQGEVRDRGIKIGVVSTENELVGNGSGFMISEHGYVLTNEHVVADRDIDIPQGADDRVRIVAHLRITRIEVCPSAASQPAGGIRNPCVEASVFFADAEADLAVLYVGGAGRPYLALGDSDAVSSGEPIQVLGYPFGVRFEVGREITLLSDTPAMSTVTGAVSALVRSDRDGDHLQLNANVNPGNSGGPVVNRDGYVIGVIQSKLLNANSVGFAVPVNRVKDFLEAHLLDQLLPAHRLRLGAQQTLEGKGIALRLPEGIADTSPFRTRVEGESASTGIALRIDRVFSPWSPRDLATNLQIARTFESQSFVNGGVIRENGPVLVGRAVGLSSDKKDVGIYFAILTLGSEAIVARYVGPADEMAFNAHVLDDSLASLEVRTLISGDLPAADTVDSLNWAVPASMPSALPMPEGWVVEPRGPSCTAIQPPIFAQASPRQDFTLTLRFGIWMGASIDPAQVAAVCAVQRGSLGASSYAAKQDRFGVSYAIEGVFISLGPDRVIQIEAVVPEDKRDYARSLLSRWVDKLTPSGAPR